MQARQQQEACLITGLQGPRIDLLGHQLYIASEVGNRHAPRVLLADEVGLGKTIEAGMIIHQQLLSHRAFRVLITVPQSLVNQWFIEMIRRFNLHFSIFDKERVESLTDLDDIDFDNSFIEHDEIEIENPFLSEQLILCSHEFLTQCNLKQLIDGEWDLLVVDEAHHLEWSPNQASETYQRVETISQQVPGLLLLSATPEQLGQESHFARLRLLDPARFHNLQAFLKEQEAYQPIADLIKQLIESSIWKDSLKSQIANYIDDIEICESNRKSIIKELLDRNGTGRVVYRNTRQAIKGFPNRKLTAHPVDYCEQYEFDMHDDLTQTIEGFLCPEKYFSDDSWVKFDSRVIWLSSFLKQNRDKKVLIICADKNTAMALDAHCRFKLGINSSAFHEDLDLISRDRAAAHFADKEDGAQALFCSEIGSEGRNFQFSHQLVLMDLPINPDLLEQRIGRLDRIGQTEDIQIHVPFMQTSPQEVIFNWYHMGMNAFEKPNASGHAIYQQTQAQLFDALIDYKDLDQQKSLIDTTQKIAQEINQKVQQAKDELLAYASYDSEIAEKLITTVSERDQKTPNKFMQRCWDKFGVKVDDHSDDTYIIEPGDHMYIGSFPSLPEDGITVTYGRNKALSRDDMQFLTWEHPMVRGVIDLILSEDKGNSSVCILKNKAIPAGTLLMEVLYQIECTAPKYLQAQRFLPYQTTRFLVDKQGNDLANKVSHTQLSQQCQKIPKHHSRQVIKSESKIFRSMLAEANQMAQSQSEELLGSLVSDMKQYQTEELNRLISLQKKNPNIREQEIEFVKNQTELLANHLGNSKVQLAAIRLIVAV